MTRNNLLNYFIASIWLINGLVCKVLNMAPRHQEIVAAILGDENARMLTMLICFAEIIMAAWILSGIQPSFNAVIQIVVIAIMNILEFILVPDLLLWGKFNLLFAFIFILIIYYNSFHREKKVIRE